MDVSICLDTARPWPDLLALATGAEAHGVHAVYVPDHFGAFREAWTVVASLAASTSRVRVGTLVVGVTHRPTAVLAHMAATLHEAIGDRLVLGVGAAWNAAEHQALGLPFPPAGRRLELLAEAAEALAALGVTVLVGGGGERRTMPIAAQHAAAWHTWAEPSEFQRKCALLDDLCVAAGRPPADVRRVTGAVLLGDDDPASTLAAFEEAGADEFVVRDHRDYAVADSLAAL